MAGCVISLRSILRVPIAVRPAAAWQNIGRCLSIPSTQQVALPPSLAAAASSRLRLLQTWSRPEEVVKCRRWYGGEGPTLTVSELQEQVLNVLKMFDKIDPDKVNLQAHFVNDLGLDSLDVVEIVMAFEDEFAVEIDDDQAEKIFTATDAVEFLKVKLDIH